MRSHVPRSSKTLSCRERFSTPAQLFSASLHLLTHPALHSSLHSCALKFVVHSAQEPIVGSSLGMARCTTLGAILFTGKSCIASCRAW